jgi:hypothetical protein
MGKKDDGGKGAAIQAAGYNMEQAKLALEKVGIPPMEAQKIVLERPELVGRLIAEELGPSAMEDIGVDPRLKGAQMDVLAGFQELTETGLAPEDMAAYRQLGRTGAREEQARQRAILQGMQQRGTLDSGAQLAAQLASSQGAAERRQQEGERIAAEAAAARRSALAQTGQLGSQIRGQQFSEAAQKAQASDIINKFNVANRQQVAGQNLAERQRIAEAQAASRNQQQLYNKQLIQQQFQNEMAKQGGIAGAYSGTAQQQMQAAQLAKPKKSPWGTVIGGAVGATAGGLAGGPMGAGAGGQMGMQVGSMFKDGGVVDKNANLKEMYAKLKDLKEYRQKYANGDIVDAYQDDLRGMMGDYAPYQATPPLAPLANDRGIGDPNLRQPMVPTAPTLQESIAAKTATGQDFTDREWEAYNEMQGLGPDADKAIDSPNKSSNAGKLAALKGLASGLKQSLKEEEQTPVDLGNIEIDPYKLGLAKRMANGGVASLDPSRIMDSGQESYVGDKVPAELNDREIVVNLDGQQRLLDALKGKRADEAVADGDANLNEDAQEQLMDYIQGNTGELPSDDIIEENPGDEDKVENLENMLAKFLTLTSE